MIDRYASSTMSQIWERKRQIRLWTEIELAWLYQHSETGWMDARMAPIPTPSELAEKERSTHHEFVAFLELWSEGFCSDEAQRWVHYGLTSSDVIDVATVVQLRDTHIHLVFLGRELIEQLTRVIEGLGDMVQVGRTHGQWAQPRRAAVPVRALRTMVSRSLRNMSYAMNDVSEGDFSGPTGGRHMLDSAKVTAALQTLGLGRADTSTQILLRDAWSHWARCVVGLLTACEAIADHYWFLAQSEIGEVEVTAGAGSSAMPHKRGNPHRAENIRGLARTARALVSGLDESPIQRGDRDLGHSSAERIILPDLGHLASTVLDRTISVCQQYQYAPERVEGNLVLALHDRCDSAEQLTNLVRAGMSRAVAIEKIQG